MVETGAGSAKRKRKELTEEQQQQQKKKLKGTVREHRRKHETTLDGRSTDGENWKEFERIQNWSWIVSLPPRKVCNMSILFMKYSFTVHGGITLGHGGHYCNTTGL